MSHRIPDSFLKELRDRIDIVELLSGYIKLKKQGHNYTACCPFHSEKTPSFSVNAIKQFYHCFGCGEHGDVISFLEKYQGLGFIDAVKHLADMANMVVPTSDVVQETHHELYELMQKVSKYYAAMLRESCGQNAVQYLKRRGLSGQVAKHYEIGYAPSGWQNLVNLFGKDKASLALLLRAGLIIQSERNSANPYYDRFRDRVMFPIRDVRGRIIGFGGRVLDDSKPKYLNSPETPIFHKGHALYGLYEANHVNQEQVLIVEGYMDVVALAQFQNRPTVAALGTAVSEEHLFALFKRFETLCFCFDGDRAGRDAAWKTLLKLLPILPEQKSVRFVFFPEGDDPDSYIRSEGVEAFETILKRGNSLSEYFFSHLMGQCPPNSLDNRAKFVNLARPLIKKIPEGVFKEMMFDKLASLAGTSRSAIDGKVVTANNSTFVRGSNFRQIKAGPRFTNITPDGLLPHPAKILVYLLVHNPEMISLVPDDFPALALSDPAMTHLKITIECIRDCTKNNAGDIYTALGDVLPAYYLEKEPVWLQMMPALGTENEFLGALNKLKVLHTQEMTQKLLIKAKEGNLTDQDKQLLKSLLSSS